MVQEFEGRTEKEAIDAAAEKLGLERDGFDVEILESLTGGIFKKGKVRIRVHTRDETPVSHRRQSTENVVPEDEFESRMLDFTKRVIEGMGYTSEVTILFREEKKLGIRIESEHAVDHHREKGEESGRSPASGQCLCGTHGT